MAIIQQRQLDRVTNDCRLDSASTWGQNQSVGDKGNTETLEEFRFEAHRISRQELSVDDSVDAKSPGFNNAGDFATCK
jgi:hypothetical protein